MKKIIYVVMSLMLLFGCKKKEDPQPAEPELVQMSFYARTKLLVDDEHSFITGAKFFLFDASNGEKFKKEIVEFPETEWYKAKSEMAELLRNNSEFAYDDGTKAIPIYIDDIKQSFIHIFVDSKDKTKWNALFSQNSVNVPEGEYYLVALYDDLPDYGYRDKYTGKYITITKNMDRKEKTISVFFIKDTTRKGYVDWVSE